MKIYHLIVIIIVLVAFSNVHAQKNEGSELDSMKEAYMNVQQGNYADALPYYLNMLDLYPKDPTYNYYAGRCVLFAEQDYEKAIGYLRYASVRNVPFDVYFYLGLAYLNTYQFEDAIANFRWFEKSGSKKELRELAVSNYISMAQNGLYLIKYFKIPQVYKKESAYKGDFYSSYDIKGLEGRFFDRYLYLKHERDSLAEQSILFVPDFMEPNEVLYFSAKNRKRGDYDIFRITRRADDTWSDPENLGDIINTPFDENYPFIHADGATLYFASKGHYSMGGYDLYRSSWDWETQEWSEPENLDFPINSPFDDVLFVLSPDKKFACFASDRDLLKSKYQVYKIRLDNQNPYSEYVNSKQIENVAFIDVNEIVEDKELKKEIIEEKPVKTNSIVKVKRDEGFIRKSEYDSLLNLAVQLQLKADSVRWLIDDQRKVFDNTSNGHERAQIGNRIIELEQKIYSLQKQADGCYEKVREIEQLNLAFKKLSYESDEIKEKVEEEKTQEQQYPKGQEFINTIEEPEDNDFEKSELQAVISEDPINGNYQYGLDVVWPSKYNQTNPIKINEQLPDGLIYMIQLGAFSSEKNPAVFKGLEPLTCIKKGNSKIHKYYAGMFVALNNAEKKLSVVKSKGFKDAYIVAFQDGEIIPINSAIRQETVQVPMEVTEEKKEGKATGDQNLGIIYVIQGEVSLENEQLIDEIREVLDEGLDLFVKKNTNTLKYIINSFKTYDDALKIKTQLESIVKKDVEVHAYFAENQIPIEQARKITK